MMFDCVPVVSVISPITITSRCRGRPCQAQHDDGAHEGQDDQAQLEQQEATDSRGVFPDVFLVSPLSRTSSSRRSCSLCFQLVAWGMLRQSASTEVCCQISPIDVLLKTKLSILQTKLERAWQSLS